MPAAAVIPAPIAYIKVVAVKTLVVGLGPGICAVSAQMGEYCVGAGLFPPEPGYP